MNLLHLQYFYVVTKENGFTNASKILRIQQPAISRMVKLLEEDLGFKLFEKVGRNVRLTKEGHDVFEHCKKVFGAVDELKNSLGQISGECKGPLLVGASEVIAGHFLPKILHAYLKEHTEVYPNIISGPTSVLLEKIIQGDLELGIFSYTPELSEKLEVYLSKNVRHHLVVNAKNRRKKEVLRKFIGSREIDDSGTKEFPTLKRLKKDYPEAHISISTNNLTAHKKMVLEGMGVAILPDFLIQNELASGKLVDIYPQEKFFFEIRFVKRKTAVLSLSAREFIKFCAL